MMTADAQFWNRIAQSYAARPVADAAAYQVTLDRVAQYLHGDQVALELGCGTGSTAVTLAPHVAQIIATDLSQAMIDIGARRALEAGVTNLQLQVAEPLTAPEGPFDVVLAFNLFHLLAAQDDSLHAAAMRLRPGGLFISKTICLKDTRSAFKRILMRGLIPLMQLVGKAPEVVHFMTVADWQARIEAAGFDIIETGNYPADPPNHFVVARKR
ncbi:MULTISPECIES: class I SAM-dependent methyltransferase [unclassified Epibacterium]|uniref:class I SAM-dependent methyltransferase n=1 Tax=unclassified Epibacterium TaxID=2639179 RepID=UPI00351D85CD